MTVLVHIGYAKTATSWLQEHLFANEGTGLGWIRKEAGNPVRRLIDDDPLDFDAAATRAAIDPLLDAVRGRGLVPVVSVERLVGHPFSGGYDSKEIADRIAAVFPEGRVLEVIREQRSMILSTYKQSVRAGSAATVEEFLDPPRSKSRRVPWFDFRFFEYDRLLGRYQRLLGPERVLALTFEQFADDTAAFVRAIGEFAGRPLGEDVVAQLPLGARENAAPSARCDRGAAAQELHRALRAEPGGRCRAPRTRGAGRRGASRRGERRRRRPLCGQQHAHGRADGHRPRPLRLDALGSAENELLELAACVGRERAERRLVSVIRELERVRRQVLKDEHAARHAVRRHPAAEVEAAAGVDEVDRSGGAGQLEQTGLRCPLVREPVAVAEVVADLLGERLPRRLRRARSAGRSPRRCR